MPTPKPLTPSELKWYNAHVDYLSGNPPAGHDPNKYNMFNLLNRMGIETNNGSTRRTGSHRPTGPARTVGSVRSVGPSGPPRANVANITNTANSRSARSNSSSKQQPVQKRTRSTPQNISTGQAVPKRTRRANSGAIPTTSIQTVNTMTRSNHTGTANHVVNRPRANATPRPDPYHLKAYFPHQKRAIQIAQRSAKSYTSLKRHNAARPQYAFRGGLIWHGTGSGKTSTILGTITKYLEAAEKTKTTPPYLCIVTTIANERQNDLEKYIENFTKLSYDLAVEMVKKKDREIHRYETIRVAENLKKYISSYIKFFTYEKFASCLKLYDNNNIAQDKDCLAMREDKKKNWADRGIVIILDESHELIKANLADMNEGKKNEYQAILRTKRMLLESESNPFVHVYAASATPGTNIGEYVETLNIVRPVGLPKFTEHTIGKHLVQKTSSGKTVVPGIYQFADFVDLTHNRKFFAKKTTDTVKTPITAWHYLAMLMRLEKVKRDESKQANKLNAGEKTRAESAQLVYRFYDREGYLATLRRLENWIELNDVKMIKGVAKGITPSKLFDTIAKQYYDDCLKIASARGISTNAVNKAFHDGKATIRVNSKTVIVTPKLFTIASNIIATPGKQFVYSNDAMSNQIVAKLLEKIQGWVDITTGVAKRAIRYPDPGAKNAGSITAPSAHESRDFRRYILTNDAKNIATYQAFMSGLNLQPVTETKWKPEPGTTARYKRNADGRACRVIFTAGSLYTGVDINALRVVHLTNPFASKVSTRQAHGRATRASGHAFLPEADRDCKVLTYITTVSKTIPEKTLDDMLQQIPADKDKNKYRAAQQWLLKKAKIPNAFRVGGVNKMQLNGNFHTIPNLFPSADSIVERQATFDNETAALDRFEKMLSAKIKSQK